MLIPLPRFRFAATSLVQVLTSFLVPELKLEKKTFNERTVHGWDFCNVDAFILVKVSQSAKCFWKKRVFVEEPVAQRHYTLYIIHYTLYTIYSQLWRWIGNTIRNIRQKKLRFFVFLALISHSEYTNALIITAVLQWLSNRPLLFILFICDKAYNNIPLSNITWHHKY